MSSKNDANLVTRKSFDLAVNSNRVFGGMDVHVIVTKDEFIIVSEKVESATKTRSDLTFRLRSHNIYNPIRHNMMNQRIFNIVQDTLTRMMPLCNSGVNSSNPYVYHIYVGEFYSE